MVTRSLSHNSPPGSDYVIQVLQANTAAMERQADVLEMLAERLAVIERRSGKRRTGRESVGLALYALFEDSKRSQRECAKQAECDDKTLRNDPIWSKVFGTRSAMQTGVRKAIFNDGHWDSED